METYNTEIFGTNNALEINQTQNTYNFHYKYRYEYKANGYPKVVRTQDQNDLSGTYKGVFVFTK